ncbi:MAG: hypothetical protein K8R41_08175, partial [Bacteroidales bacterium]|nr:hypothetical protein [Bacteroidales bacterium]
MKKASKLLLLLLFVSIQTTYAQIEEMREKMQDQMTEMEEGKLTLRFINAVDGDAVVDATIKIDELGEFTTDRQGRVLFEVPKDGIYSMGFEKPGFIPVDLKFEIMEGMIFYNRFSVSPKLDMGTIRIVLDWDGKPKDLDAHLVKEGKYHISYRDKKSSADGKAILDRDDLDGYGPETITVTDVDDDAEYKFYVKDFTNRDRNNSKRLSKSKARVKIYGEGELLHEFKITERLKGNTWMVFRIVKGEIKIWDEVNRYY